MRVMPVLGVVMILVSQAASQSVTNTQASATQEHSFAFISSQDFKAIMGNGSLPKKKRTNLFFFWLNLEGGGVGRALKCPTPLIGL